MHQAHPSLIEIEGLVHELQPNLPHFMQERAACALTSLAADHPRNRAAIAATGAIPSLMRLGWGSWD
jgi:hypothetical protein